MSDWKLPAFGVFVAWGLWSFVPKLTVRYLDPRSAIVYETLGAIAVAVTLLWTMNFKVQAHPVGIALAIGTGAMGFLGGLCFLVAVSRGPVSLVTILSALYPVLTVALAILLLGESLTLRQGVGVALALVAMGLVAS